MTNPGSRDTHALLAEMPTKVASGVAIWRETAWGDMRVGYETYLADFDDAPLLKGLPDNRCQCPHWGYLIAGRMTVHYQDRDDVVRAGELYYMAPGHTMAVEAGTVLVEFSPREQFEQLTEIAERNFARLGKGGDDLASPPTDR